MEGFELDLGQGWAAGRDITALSAQVGYLVPVEKLQFRYKAAMRIPEIWSCAGFLYSNVQLRVCCWKLQSFLSNFV